MNHKKYPNRLLSLIVLTAICVVTSFELSAQRRLLILSWNVQSGDNDSETIAKRLADFEGYDIYALTEVSSSNFQAYASAAAVGEGSKNSDQPNYDFVNGTTGGADRMMIIWDNKRFQKIGDAQELFDLSEGNHRAPLFCRFKIRNTDIEFVILVNHLARGNTSLRNKQAQGLAQWASNQTVPIIALGDYNFDYDIDDGFGNDGFNNMLAGGHWSWLKPKRLYQTQMSPKFHSVLDFVFTANLTANWEGYSTIILSHPALDDDKESDHRPLEAHFYINE